ncbi:hypothetical protein [Chamaesiphon minutus]|uniref:Uncharacterized protein n=1 Tax=Chamaesiphon minutus (strain ATCC 27169 / PCC 6605) TaxID=1173020 RepID=K9UFY5_CHAP6|nr:hypothetical protein [Chamaesiphon minutus]AFY93124.1 hypothetical protein Cha6605_2024 [Chamaesiphon minutus PCC 6605]
MAGNLVGLICSSVACVGEFVLDNGVEAMTGAALKAATKPEAITIFGSPVPNVLNQ